MLTAADFDVRGAFATIQPTIADYNVRGGVATIQPEIVDFDVYQFQTDLQGLRLNGTSPAPSPLPFDLEGLHVSEPVPVAGPPTEQDHLAIIEAICKFDYGTLERYAQRGHNFNSHAKFDQANEHRFNERGTELVWASEPPLNHAVWYHFSRTAFDLRATLQLIQWLVAHGADPETRNAQTGTNMWNMVWCYTYRGQRLKQKQLASTSAEFQEFANALLTLI